MNWRLPVTGLAVIAAVGVASQVVRTNRQRTELARLQAAIVRVDAEASAARRERDRAVRQETANRETPSSAVGPLANPAIQDETLSGRWLQRGRALGQLIDQNPDRRIPQMSLLNDEDLLIAAQTLKIDSEDDARKSLQTLRDQVKAKFVPYLQLAFYDYAAANEDRIPTEIGQLAPYLKPPLTADMLGQFEIVRTGLLAEVPANAWIAAEKAPVDDRFDSRMVVSATGYGKQAVTPDVFATARAIAAFASANAGRKPTVVSQLQPFLDASVDPEAIRARFELWQTNPETMGIRIGQSTRQTHEQLVRTLPPL